MKEASRQLLWDLKEWSELVYADLQFKVRS